MSRRRYISTEMSSNGPLADLTEYGLLPVLLYTWAIPHMDDWGRMTGESRQFKLLVCPGLDVTVRDVDEALDRISEAGLWMRFEIDGKKYIAIRKSKWFKYQSYIAAGKRDDDRKSVFPRPPMDTEWHETPNNAERTNMNFDITPQNAAEHQNEEYEDEDNGEKREMDYTEVSENAEEEREVPLIAASPSLSPSPSPSPSLTPSPSTTSTTTAGGAAPNSFRMYETEGFGLLSPVIADQIRDFEKEYGERWVCEAMKEAALSGVRTMRYVNGILKRYKSSGIDQPWNQPKNDPQTRNYHNSGRSGKAHIPIVDNKPSEAISQEELEELRKIARKLDGKGDSS